MLLIPARPRSMPDDEPLPEAPMADAMEPRDVERGQKAKRPLREDAVPAESAVAASGTHEDVRPKQLN